jgi:hypothetical protein
MASLVVVLGIGGGPVPDVLPGDSQVAAPVLTSPESDPAQQVAELRRLGGTVFERDGAVVEVNLNRTRVEDRDLDRLAVFTAMTDLSLEETAIGDDGLRRLAGLKVLVWLNLYRTRVGDDGLSHLRASPVTRGPRDSARGDPISDR